jgi:2-dehydropantoate 2-reductase
MKICVIGAGALGSLYSANLKAAGHDVGLVASRQVYLDAVKANNGIIVEEPDSCRTVPCPVSLNAMDFAPVDLSVVITKSAATGNVAAIAAKCLGDNGYVLTLQNGLGNADVLAQHIDANRILAGTSGQSAILLSPGVTKHTGFANNVIGAWGPKTDIDKIKEIARIFTEAKINTDVSDEVRTAIWDKLFINIGVNAIGALAKLTNGQINKCPSSNLLARQAIGEAVKVAEALAIKVRDDVLPNFERRCEISYHTRNSMLQDLSLKRLTEIDFINGAISRLGKEHNIPTPVNDVLTNLVHAAEYGNEHGDNA